MSNVIVFMMMFLYPFAPKQNPIIGMPEDMPVACYDFEQALTDETGNFHLNGDATYTIGHLGSALVSSANILSSPQNGELTSPQITISLWFSSTVSAYTNVAYVDQGASWALSVSGGDLYWGVSGSDDEFLIEEAPIADGQWHHLLTWVTGDEFRVQIDGGVVLTQTQSLPVPVSSGTLVIGESFNDYSVVIDSVKIWNRVLSQDERLADYNAGFGLSCKSLFAPTVVSLVSIDLPSGGRGELEMSMSVGEGIIAVGVLTLLLLATFDLLRRMARSGSL